MPVSPVDVEDLVAEVAEVYANAEATLLGVIGRAAAKGKDGPLWAQRRLDDVPEVRRQLETAFAPYRNRVLAILADLADRAYRAGARLAGKDIPKASARRAAAALAAATATSGSTAAVAALTAELTQKVTGTHLRILRATEDMYRQAVGIELGEAAVGTITRRDAAQAALARLAENGITGYTSVDKNGRRRNWDLVTYVETATRTSLAAAQHQGAVDRWTQAGRELVVISSISDPSDRCHPWQGKVLSLTGRVPEGVPAGVVAGTLSEAMSKGLFGPNCRHSMTVYQHGITSIPKVAIDEQGYKDRQRLRELERRTRRAQKAVEAAGTPEALAAAKKKVRDRQADIRAHVASTDQVRQPHRERLGTAR